MSIYNDLVKYLKDNNIKYEDEKIEKNVYQIAFKLEKQINVFIYEDSHIKIFIPLNISVKDNQRSAALSKINELNVETYGYETALLENDYYFIKTVPLMFNINVDDLFDIIKVSEEKTEEVIGKIS